jgi:hypothetical protein
MFKLSIRQVLVLLTAVITIAINALAEIIPFNNKSTAAISDSFQTYFVPAGYVFAIWGVIYIGMIAYAVFRAQPRNKDNKLLAKLDIPFIVAGIANCVWLVLWHYEYIHLTVPVMLVLLVTLIYMYLMLRSKLAESGKGWKWCVYIPTSIYLGWITVATIANISDALYAANWTGLGLGWFPQTWAGVMIMVAALLTAFILLTRHDIAYALVIVWAVIGIYMKFPTEPAVAYASVLAVTMIAALFVMNLFRWWRIRITS